MDRPVDEIAAEVDALARALAAERFRHVAGVAARPDLAATFDAHGVAARRDTVAELRERGIADLAGLVANLVAEREQATHEEQWRAAEAGAAGEGPDGPVGISDASLATLHERDPERRRALGRAVEQAAGSASAPREAAAEARARARASLGLTPPWERVVEGDALLGASDAAWDDVLGWAARREGTSGRPGRDLDRPGLLRLLACRDLDGAFPPARLMDVVLSALGGIGVEPRRARLDATARAVKWPGAHALEAQVSLRRQGGCADWLGLLDAAGRAATCAVTRPATRDPAFPVAVGWLAASLLLEPRFLAGATGIDRRSTGDVVRRLALRRLFSLRANAAALRVAAEVERGTSGEAWREAYGDAMARATGARWPGVLASRDSDAESLRASLEGAAWGARLARDLRERFDEDYWRNPRTPEALAGRLASGRAGPDAERPPLAEAAEALVKRMESA